MSRFDFLRLSLALSILPSVIGLLLALTFHFWMLT
jgi:hypothetical protein